MLESTVVVAMAAGSSRPGAGMEVKLIEFRLAPDGQLFILLQAASKAALLLTVEMGNRGTLERTFKNWRRESLQSMVI